MQFSANRSFGWFVRKTLPVMYSGTITGLRVCAFDGNAVASGGALLDGANASVTALADGTNQISIYDAGGRVMKGVLKAVGTGETLDVVINTGTLTALKLYKIVSTVADHFRVGLGIGGYFTSNGTETCDGSNTVQAVLTPSNVGSTIVSAKSGVTYNWSLKNGSFVYDGASFSVIIRKLR